MPWNLDRKLRSGVLLVGSLVMTAANAQTVVVPPSAGQTIVIDRNAPPSAAAPSDAVSRAPEPRAPVTVSPPRTGDLVIPNVGQLIIELGAKQTDKGTLVSLQDDVLFDFDKDTLRPEATDKLSKLAQLITGTHPPSVSITGYTDSIGTDQYNVDLSIRRARSVQTWLLDQGHIPPTSIQVEGHGKADPVAANTLPNGADNPAGRQLNRRVDILLGKS